MLWRMLAAFLVGTVFGWVLYAWIDSPFRDLDD